MRLQPADAPTPATNRRAWLPAPAHLPEYLMEAAGLGLFMVSACLFAVLFEHPDSPFRQSVAEPLLRRLPMGLAMGATALGLILSPWGQRSGAHYNPAVTFTYWRLGKVAPADAAGYIAAQLAGGVLGVGLAAAIVGAPVAHPAVNYVATTPGPTGAAVALAAELVIAFGLMLTVLTVSNTPRLARYTPFCAAGLVALYITVEAPLSGMSMNPARSLGSAAWAGAWLELPIYVVAPLLGMLTAAQTHLWRAGAASVICAKLNHPHHDRARCIFRCGYRARPEGEPAAVTTPRA